MPARVGRDADAAREPRDTGGRRALVGYCRQCGYGSGYCVWAVLVRKGRLFLSSLLVAASTLVLLYRGALSVSDLNIPILYVV